MRGQSWAAVVAGAALVAACGGDGSEMRVKDSGFSAGPAATAPAEPGLWVHGTAETTVAADRAYVVATLGSDPFGIGATLSDRDRTRVVDALAEAGFAEGVDVSRGSSSSGLVPTVTVEVPVGELPEVGERVVDAIEGAVDKVASKGVWFGVADCNAALGGVREAALAQARERAGGLARIAGVDIGEVVSVQELPPGRGVDPFGASSDPCGTRPPGPSPYGLPGALARFDEAAEVDLYVDVGVTFALARADRSITATGTAVVEGDADEAWIVVSRSEEDFGFPGTGTSLRDDDRAALVRELGKLDVTEDRIVMEEASSAGFPFSSPTVRVRVSVSRLPGIGKEVVRAVDDALDGNFTGGVLFRASNCDGMLARAREEAYADAQDRVAALARAAEVEVGDVVALRELPSADAFGYSALFGGSVSPLDPCGDDDLLERASGLGSFLTGGADLVRPFDADPVVEVRVELQVSRAIR